MAAKSHSLFFFCVLLHVFPVIARQEAENFAVIEGSKQSSNKQYAI